MLTPDRAEALGKKLIEAVKEGEPNGGAGLTASRLALSAAVKSCRNEAKRPCPLWVGQDLPVRQYAPGNGVTEHIAADG